MSETRRKFDHDFREGAVRLVRETGKPIAQVARDLGINEGTLGNWVNADTRHRGEGNGVLDEDERQRKPPVPGQPLHVRVTTPLLASSALVFADLSGLPALIIQTGTHEVLLDDAVRLARQAATPDVQVALDITPRVPHVFPELSPILDEGAAALDRAGQFLSAHLALQNASPHSERQKQLVLALAAFGFRSRTRRTISRAPIARVAPFAEWEIGSGADRGTFVPVRHSEAAVRLPGRRDPGRPAWLVGCGGSTRCLPGFR
jgi:transposase-like protein